MRPAAGAHPSQPYEQAHGPCGALAGAQPRPLCGSGGGADVLSRPAARLNPRLGRRKECKLYLKRIRSAGGG